MAEAEPCGMCISAGGATSVKGLQGPKTMLGMSPLEMAVALTTSRLDHVQLAVKHVCLGHDVKDPRVQLVVASELSDQSPVICAAGQLHGLVVGR